MLISVSFTLFLIFLSRSTKPVTRLRTLLLFVVFLFKHLNQENTYTYFEHYFCSPQAPYKIKRPSFWSDEMVNWLNFERKKKLYPNDWIRLNPDIIEGRLIGGNNNAMYGFIGTPYFPKIKHGDILLIEDTIKHPSVIEKNIAMLKLHGILDLVGGIILGKHEQYDDAGTGKQPLDFLLE